MKVYIAAPFFTKDQLEEVMYMEEALSARGFEVFSPRLDTRIPGNATSDDQKKAFNDNLTGILDSGFVLAITMNKDMGTVFECGYAYANKVPILYYAPGIDGPFNLMLAQSASLGACTSCFEVVSILDDIRKRGLSKVMEDYEYEGEIE